MLCALVLCFHCRYLCNRGVLEILVHKVQKVNQVKMVIMVEMVEQDLQGLLVLRYQRTLILMIVSAMMYCL